MNKLFVIEMIPDKSAVSLACAIVTDAIHRYARAVVNIKEYEETLDPRKRQRYEYALITSEEIESFFMGDWFANIVEYMNIEITGKRLIKQIRKAPKKYCNKCGRRCKYEN